MTIQDVPAKDGSVAGRRPDVERKGAVPGEVSRSRREDKAIARFIARRGGARIERPLPLTTSPLVSVVIPCYNYGHFLEDCTRSVLSQPGVTTEVIIIDDASPDGSGEVAERLAESDSRITVIRHRSNKGHIATFNEGIDAVTGDYQLLLSSDDLLVPGSLARAVALMEVHPGVAMVYGRAISFGGPPLPTPRTAVTYWAVWPGAVWLRRRFDLGQNTVFTPTAVLRTSVQRTLGGYLPELPHAGDLEMWLRFATAGDVGFIGGAEQAYYRVHGSNMSATTYAGGQRDIQQRHQAFSAVLTRMPVDLAGELAPLARRALAARALELAGDSRRAGDQESFGGYVRLALEVDPRCHHLPEWRALTEHRASSLSPLALGRWAGRKLTNHLMWEQTHWYGG